MLGYTPIFDRKNGPMRVEPESGHPSLIDSVIPYLSEVKQRLLDHGAILFRNFKVMDTEDFDNFVAEMSDRHFKYLYRSTPRSEVTTRVSTATSYPPKLEIHMHNENSYQRKWPLTIAFCCTVVPDEGGETPIAPMQAVSEYIGEELMNKFEQLGVEYIRHYHEGVDLSWENVFQTESRELMQQYCADNDIRCKWVDHSLLQTSQVAQGVASHPVTKKKIFFNQSHLFHASSLGKAQADALLSMFGKDRLPRHARFGNASEIPISDLERIQKAFKANVEYFPWQQGDVLLLDNMQYAHGRRPFKGNRSVFAALMDPYPYS
jgi:alpha-ketoglutarate-dependent taurine dioxygenase